MIFVTVGTHEQPFDRLLEKVDSLKKVGVINDEVVMQIGFSNYIPSSCKYEKFFGHDEMEDYVKNARIIITHGGPSSFIMPLQVGKVPIVVPRREKYGEHVNDHQVDFVKQVTDRKKNIIVVDDINDLENTLNNYVKIVDSMNQGMSSNNKRFNEQLQKIIENLF